MDALSRRVLSWIAALAAAAWTSLAVVIAATSGREESKDVGSGLTDLLGVVGGPCAHTTLDMLGGAVLAVGPPVRARR